MIFVFISSKFGKCTAFSDQTARQKKVHLLPWSYYYIYIIHHNLIFPDAPQEEVLEDLLPPVVAQDSNYTFSESEIEPENSTNDDDLPEILLGPSNVTAYLGM